MLGGCPPSPLTAGRAGTEDGWVPLSQPWIVSPPDGLEEVSIPMAVREMNKAAAGLGPGRGSHLRVIGVEWLHYHPVMGGPELRAGEAPVSLR